MLDLSRKSALTDTERRDVAEALQCAFLIELFKASKWNVDDAVLHGGTGLRLCYGSPRWSEDLDFLLREDLWLEGLSRAVDRAAAGVRSRLELEMPGSEITLKPPKRLVPGEDGVARTARYKLRWGHDMRQGAVTAWLEFCRTAPELLSEYGKERRDFRNGRDRALDSLKPIPVATPDAVWADKVVAVGARHEMKLRDAFDLWQVARLRRGEGQDPEAASGALETTCRVYGLEAEAVAEAVERRLGEGAFSDVGAFARDMGRWVPDWDVDSDRDIFGKVLETAREECARGAELLRAGPAPGPGRS